MAITEESSVHVLHVDDETGLAEMVADLLERIDPRLVVEPTTQATTAIERFESGSFDAIVSDFDMPEMTGLELLDYIRDVDFEIPFILYTGKGNEEIASDAITRGVTEYMQKGTGTDQYEVLANRVVNAVERYKAERDAEAATERFRAVFERAFDAMIIADDDGSYIDMNSAAADLFDRAKVDLLGHTAEEFTVEEFDFSEAWETFKSRDRERGLFPLRRPDGEIRIAEYAATANIRPGEHLSVLRDVTNQQAVEQRAELERQRLEEFAGVLSHDLKNPVSVARGRLELAQNGATPAERTRHLESIEDAIIRIEHIIEDVLAISSSTGLDLNAESISVSDLAAAVWNRVRRGADRADIEPGLTVRADRGHLERLLTNLLRNAIEHTGSRVAVTIGTLSTGDGFYIEDDGPGIPPGERDSIFEWQHSTKVGGTGIGLRSVKQIVEAQGWTITVTDGQNGGARFEIGTEAST